MALFNLMALLAFLLVFFVTYALLAKTKLIGDNNFIHLISSLLIAAVFVASPNAKELTIVTIPWLAVLIVVVFVVILLFTFLHGKLEDVVESPLVSIIIIIIILVIFLTAAINVFGPFLSQYLPGPNQKAGIISFILNPAVLGGVVLTIIAAIASYVLTKE